MSYFWWRGRVVWIRGRTPASSTVTHPCYEYELRPVKTAVKKAIPCRDRLVPAYRLVLWPWFRLVRCTTHLTTRECFVLRPPSVMSSIRQTKTPVIRRHHTSERQRCNTRWFCGCSDRRNMPARDDRVSRVQKTAGVRRPMSYLLL